MGSFSSTLVCNYIEQFVKYCGKTYSAVTKTYKSYIIQKKKMKKKNLKQKLCFNRLH